MFMLWFGWFLLVVLCDCVFDFVDIADMAVFSESRDVAVFNSTKPHRGVT